MLKLCCSITHHRALGMMPAARSRRSPSCSPCAHGGCGPPTLSTQRAVASATLASHCTALALVALAVCRDGKSPAGCPKTAAFGMFQARGNLRLLHCRGT